AHSEVAGRADLGEASVVELQAVGAGSEIFDLVRANGRRIRHIAKDEYVVAQPAGHLVPGRPSDDGVVAFPAIDAMQAVFVAQGSDDVVERVAGRESALDHGQVLDTVGERETVLS